jgi:hypothetical protein
MEEVGMYIYVHILGQFGLSYGHLVFLWPFGIFGTFFPFWYVAAKASGGSILSKPKPRPCREAGFEPGFLVCRQQF